MRNQEEINQFKVDRKRMMDNFLKESSLQRLLVARWKGIQTEPINFSDMKLLGMHDWVEVNPKVRFKLIERDENRLVFLTEMKKGGEFGSHHHDDCTEVCMIDKGHIYCLETQKEAKEGEELCYAVAEAHTPIALEESVFKVYFNKI